MLVVSVLAAPLFRVLDTVADGDFYIQAIAVDPELRGQGLGSRLLDLAEERAREKGCRRLALDVAGSNRGARALYARRGFEVESQWPRRIVIPGLRLLRMVSSLG